MYVKMADDPMADRLLNLLDDALPKGHPDHYLVVMAATVVAVLGHRP